MIQELQEKIARAKSLCNGFEVRNLKWNNDTKMWHGEFALPREPLNFQQSWILGSWNNIGKYSSIADTWYDLKIPE